MTLLRHHLLILLFALASFLLPRAAGAAETIPPKPANYFNDYAGVITNPAVIKELDDKLSQFERDTSNQIRVAIYPKMLSDSSIDDYTLRIANAWRIGMKGKENGTILFVFKDDKKAFIQVGYGLEGALPDATCKRIIDTALAPAFAANNYEAGLRAAIVGILEATKDEFKGTGKTAADTQSLKGIIPWVIGAIALFIGFGILLFIIHTFGGTFYQNHVRSLSFAENSYMFFLNIVFSMLASGGRSSSSSGGGGSSGGSSSGGGSFGGGGAGGSW